jgi:hypothetical protein
MPFNVDELHHLFAVEKLSLAKIAAALQSSEGAVRKKIAQLRKREGVERWPVRSPAVHPPAPKPERHRPGEPTLPPLASVIEFKR